MKRSSALAYMLFASSFATLAQDTCTVDAISIPDALDSWQWVSGSYPPGGSVTYELPLLQSNSITYVFKTGCGDGAWADHNTVLEYRTTPPCLLVMADSGSCAQGGSELDINFVVWEGPSRIRVRGANGEGGSFTLAYRSIGGMPGNCNECPSFDEALAPGSYWQTVDGSYGIDGCKVYKVSVANGLTYDFKTGCGDGATADHDTRISISNVYCNELVSNDNGCEAGRSSTTWTATGASTIFVRVAGASGEAGNFSMAYRRSGGNGSACGSCTDYDANLSASWDWATVSGNYLPDGCQVYRLSQAEGYVYTYKTGCGDGASCDHDAQLELLDDSCNVLLTGTDQCGDGSSTLEFTSTGEWPLFLRVSGIDGVGGNYTLARRRHGTCPTCPDHDLEITPTLQWQTSDSSFLEYGCRVYKVNVVAGMTYAFQLECADCDWWDDLAPMMEAHDTACNTMDIPTYSLNSGTRTWSFLAEYTGAVYLRIHGDGWQGEAFTLSYKTVGPATDACLDAPVVPVPFDGFVELQGSLAGITPNGDQLAGTAWQDSAVAWYALEIPEYCYTFMVSYCGQDTALPGSMGLLATECGADSLVYGMPSFYFPCSNGNANDEYWLLQGTYYLPILANPLDPANNMYHIAVGCSNLIIDGIDAPTTTGSWGIHPNPGHDALVLTGPGIGGRSMEAWFLDMTGRVVKHLPITTTSTPMNTSELKPGAYFIRLTGETSPVVLRWIKE